MQNGERSERSNFEGLKTKSRFLSVSCPTSLYGEHREPSQFGGLALPNPDFAHFRTASVASQAILRVVLCKNLRLR